MCSCMSLSAQQESLRTPARVMRTSLSFLLMALPGRPAAQSSEKEYDGSRSKYYCYAGFWGLILFGDLDPLGNKFVCCSK